MQDSGRLVTTCAPNTTGALAGQRRVCVLQELCTAGTTIQKALIFLPFDHIHLGKFGSCRGRKAWYRDTLLLLHLGLLAARSPCSRLLAGTSAPFSTHFIHAQSPYLIVDFFHVQFWLPNNLCTYGLDFLLSLLTCCTLVLAVTLQAFAFYTCHLHSFSKAHSKHDLTSFLRPQSATSSFR